MKFPLGPWFTWAAIVANRRGAEGVKNLLTPTLRRHLYAKEGRPREYVSERIADELAVAIGMHPCDIWPGYDRDVA